MTDGGLRPANAVPAPEAPGAADPGTAADADSVADVPDPAALAVPVVSERADAGKPSDDPRLQWERDVLRHLEQQQRYPLAARERGLQDRVLMRIRIGRDGAVLSSKVTESRGYTPLDDEALALVQRASPLPSPPAAVDETALDFLVAIDFHIEGSAGELW